MSGSKVTMYVPGTNSRAWAKVEFQWPEGQCDLEAMDVALQDAARRAFRNMGERKRNEDQKTVDVGSGEG